MAGNLFNTGYKINDKPIESSVLSPAFVRCANEMTNDEFEKMRVLIYDLIGIYFTDTKKYLLESRISKRIKANKMNNFTDYIKLLNSKPNKLELDLLFDAITINETYFFRVPQQFDDLENVVLPEIANRKMVLPNPTIRIWSAAASTGEEAYTIAIIILERLKPLFPKINFEIIGTDINLSVLENARQGIYKEYAIRNVPESMLQKYFTKNNHNYILSDEVKKMVRFSQLNLYEPIELRSMLSFDVVFCANVLIYFDIPSKKKVVSNLYKLMTNGAYLFLGYTESLHGISKQFNLVHLTKAMAYQKS
jgi:chemotaxis protein methyltransferase CheR